MNKQKTHQTTAKRVKITKTGKILKKSVCIGHLKVKVSSKTKRRKSGLEEVSPHRDKQVRRLLGIGGKHVQS